MPRQEGLRPIGESVKKIIEKIKKEREERQKKSSSPRTQPKLPGMKRGGGVDTTTSPSVMELANAIKDKDRLTKADIERAKKRLMPGRSTPQAITSRKSVKDFMEGRKKMQEKKMSNDKVKESLREISARNMAIGGITEDDDEFSRRRKKLSGGQKKLDANKDGTISGEDFKILRGKQNKMKGGGIAIKGTNFKGVF